MNNDAGITNVLKEIAKELRRQNGLLKEIKDEIKDSNKYYIYPSQPIYKPEPIDPYNPYNPYYQVTCETTTAAEWTNKDNLTASQSTFDPSIRVASQITTGTTKHCPKCGNLLKRDTSFVYTSLPPKYKYFCEKCGHEEVDF